MASATDTNRIDIVLPQLMLSVQRKLGEWQHRARGRARLQQMSELELLDIGLTRAEAWAEFRKPMWRE
jgi:uncharacterized protein YjiS (DUF1127 family)